MEHLGIISLLLRTVTGVLFFFQAYDKIFRIKTSNVAAAFSKDMARFHCPPSLLYFLVFISSWIEFFGGMLLFIGLFKYYVLIFLSVDLFFVALSFSAIKAMWDMQFFFPRFIFILILWVIPFTADRYSLDLLMR